MMQNRKSHFREPLTNRRQSLFLPTIALDRQSEDSLSRQIYRQIAQAIRNRGIGENARLPATRWLAKILGVSRNTVLAAYDDLAADDLIRGTRGSGMRVVPLAGPPSLPMPIILRQAHYPAKVLTLTDPDGTPLYINF